jgi:hypothetical protein
VTSRRGFTSLFARLVPAAAALTVAALAVPALDAPAAAQPAAALTTPLATRPVTPSCAWTAFSVATENVAAPDSAATYYLLPYTVQDGLRIRLSGRYPDARYASLQAYTADGLLFTAGGVSSALTDYQIQPERGSVNPWQRPARPGRRRPAPGRFAVTFQADVTPGEANTLPLAPAGTAAGTQGYLVYRVYLPAGGDFSRVPLPAVTFTANGVTVAVPACAASGAGEAPAVAAGPGHAASPGGTAAGVVADGVVADGVAADGVAAEGVAADRAAAARAADSGAADAATAPVAFTRVVASAGGFPNADSGYLLALVSPPGGGDVVVIRGKAPTVSRGSHPSSWPARRVDMRYWSMCDYLDTAVLPLVVNPLPGGGTDYGCRYDAQTALDRHGYYTYVVGTEAQRAAIEAIRGATFVPFSTAQPTTAHLLLLRNMLVSPGFAAAIQNVAPGSGPAAAAAVMGPYYPRAAVCPLATLAARGAAACLMAAS